MVNGHFSKKPKLWDLDMKFEHIRNVIDEITYHFAVLWGYLLDMWRYSDENDECCRR